MKSKVVTFSAAEINGSGLVTKDIQIVVPAASGVVEGRTEYFKPTIMRIDNQSGANISFNLVFDPAEAADTLVNPDNYGQLRVRTGEQFTYNPMPRSSGIIGEGDGVATADLDIWFGGYVNYV